MMAVYNGERFLQQAIDGILNQAYTDFELLIIDDGSTDGTADILDTYDDPRMVRLQNPNNVGLMGSLNRGLGLARGQFVARQDADDFPLAGRLEQEVTYLEQYPEVGRQQCP